MPKRPENAAQWRVLKALEAVAEATRVYADCGMVGKVRDLCKVYSSLHRVAYGRRAELEVVMRTSLAEVAAQDKRIRLDFSRSRKDVH